MNLSSLIMLIMNMIMFIISTLMMLTSMMQKALKETLKNHVFNGSKDLKILCIKKTLQYPPPSPVINIPSGN